MQTSLQIHKHQTGVALFILILSIMLATIAYALSNWSPTQVRINQIKTTLYSLKEAKQAVINYAITHADRVSQVGEYGFLPCTETGSPFTGYGNMAPTCGGTNKNSVEWLPWRSLDLPALKDESGTCLFYAVSGTYKAGGSAADMINEDSPGMLQVVDKENPANVLVDDIVALIIAPGEALTAQTRTLSEPLSNCGKDYDNVTAYLEGNGVTDNSFISAAEDTVDTFLHATATSSSEATPYNDKFLTISRDEIWQPIVERTDFKQKMKDLTEGLAMCLVNYANLPANPGKRFPWPAKTDMGITTPANLNYRSNDNYTDDNNATAGYSGRYPYKVINSNTANAMPGLGSDLFDIANCSNLAVSSGALVTLTTTAPLTEYRSIWNNWKDHFFYVLSKAYRPYVNTSYLVNNVANYALNDTVIAVDTGAGSINIGDIVTFAGDVNQYVVSSALSGGTFSITAPGLLQTLNDDTVITVYAIPVCNIAPFTLPNPDTCIDVNTTEYAAAVIFSGSRLNGQTRILKSDMTHYLEDGKAAVFNNEKITLQGNNNYIYTNPNPAANPEIVNDVMYCISKNVLLDVNECAF